MIVHVVNAQAVLRLHAQPFRTSVCWLLHRSSLSAIPRDATISPAALASARHFNLALIRLIPASNVFPWCKHAGEPQTEAELQATGRFVACGQSCGSM